MSAAVELGQKWMSILKTPLPGLLGGLFVCGAALWCVGEPSGLEPNADRDFGR